VPCNFLQGRNALPLARAGIIEIAIFAITTFRRNLVADLLQIVNRKQIGQLLIAGAPAGPR
jgi:hypothetical protein